MMQVGDIIEKGATSIPEEVLEFEDSDGDRARRNEDGATWSSFARNEELSDWAIMQWAYFPLSVTKVAEPTAPSPLVLSLPEVPEGAVALVGKKTGERFPVRWRQGVAEVQWQRGMDGGPDPLGLVLEREESVTVEFAPPREPRTWPKLDPAEVGLKVRGRSGTVYTFQHDSPCITAYSDAHGCSLALGTLSEVDGPLTEVLD